MSTFLISTRPPSALMVNSSGILRLWPVPPQHASPLSSHPGIDRDARSKSRAVHLTAMSSSNGVA